MKICQRIKDKGPRINKKIKLLVALFILFLFIIYHSSFIIKSDAFYFPPGHHSVQVSASIGQFYVNLSGFIAPFASVVLTTDNQVLRSTAADSAGYFSISQILVKEGFTHFCFTAVDVRRLGESDACFTISPVHGDYTRTNIFLPPTIGLFRTQIQVNTNAIIWGYSMPGAVVTVHSSDGKLYTATADKTGFYQVNAFIAKAGNYDMSATAVLNSPAGQQNSEKPTNKVTLVALTFAQSTGQNVRNFLKQLLTFLFNLPLGPLWLAVPILILIFILWRKLRGEPLFPTGNPLAKEKVFFDYLFRPRKLHHHWMKGVGY